MLLVDDSEKIGEEDVYPDLFGNFDPQASVPLSASLFKQLGCRQLQPQWLDCRVMVSPPNDKHPHWLYVSSGLSLASKPQTPRYELLLEAPQAADWPISLLQQLMVEHLLQQTSTNHQSLPTGEPIAQHLSEEIPGVMLLKPLHYRSDITLAHGRTTLLQVVGITAEEWLFAKRRSTQALIEEFTINQGHYVTRLHRQSVV